MPASALLPAGEPKPAPAPSPTDGSGARETIAGQGAAPKPPSAPTVDRPKATIDPAPVLTNESPATQNHSDDPVGNSVSPPQEQHSPATQNHSNDPVGNSVSPPQEQHSPGDPVADNKQGNGGGSRKDPNKEIDPAQSEEVNVNDEKNAGLSKCCSLCHSE